MYKSIYKVQISKLIGFTLFYLIFKNMYYI